MLFYEKITINVENCLNIAEERSWTKYFGEGKLVLTALYKGGNPMRRIKKKQLIIISLVLIIGIGSIALLKKAKETRIIYQDQIKAVETLTMEEKLEDFEYLFTFVEKHYPLLKVNEKVNGIDWLGEKENFKEAIENTSTDEMFMSELTKIIDKLNDVQNYVVEMHFFKNYYVSYAGPEYKEESDPWFDVINDEKVLKRYKFDESQKKLVTDESKYKTNEVTYFRQDVIVPNEVAYLRIHGMNPDRLEEDGKLIREFLKEVKDYKKLIIDARSMNYWKGDTDNYWIKNIVEPLTDKEISVDNYILGRGEYGKLFYEHQGMRILPIRDLSDESLEGKLKTDFDYYSIQNTTINSVEPVGFKGEIYVLIDNKVVYMAENFAAFCKDSGFATLVGETTSGINWPFNTILFSLPNSGILIDMRNLISLNNDGSIREEVNIRPDIEVDATKGSTYDRDKAIQYIINN